MYDSRALLDAKAALVKFAEQVTAAISSMDAEVARLGMWLDQERPAHWKHELRRREDKVLAAKIDIQRKIIAQAPEPVSLLLERKVVHRAQARADEARKRFERVKQWSPRWEREAMMFKTSIAALSDATHRDIPLAMARLEKMLLALEAYERIAPPDSAGENGRNGGVSSELVELSLLAPLDGTAPVRLAQGGPAGQPRAVGQQEQGRQGSSDTANAALPDEASAMQTFETEKAGNSPQNIAIESPAKTLQINAGLVVEPPPRSDDPPSSDREV